MTVTAEQPIVWFSANRFGKWGECETCALADETTPAEFTAGPELLLGLAGHEALELTLLREFADVATKRQYLADQFWSVHGRDKYEDRGVKAKDAASYAQALWDLAARDDLLPSPDEILTVEGSGIPKRYLIPDIHGKPGFGVVLPGVFSDGKDGEFRIGIRGRMDTAYIPSDQRGTLMVTDWGYSREKALIASMVYAAAASVIYPGFAKYTVREVYVAAGLRYSEQSWLASEIPDLIAVLQARAGEIIAKRESKTTTTTANARCDECQLQTYCDTYQRALQPMVETPAELRKWPTDLAALSTLEVMRVRRAFTGPAQAVKAYKENVDDELKSRLSGEIDRVSDDDGYGVRLSREGNGFEYEDVGAFVQWCERFDIPLDKAMKPADNKTILRLAGAIADEDVRQQALEALDELRDEREARRVLRDLKGVRK